MSIRRHNAKRDEIEPLIVAALEAMYCQVYRLDTPCDLLCKHRGQLILIEVKMPGEPLTPAQKKFAETWPLNVVRSVEDAISLITGRKAA